MEDSAVVETLEAISASAAAMAVALRQGREHPGRDSADPLREQADAMTLAALQAGSVSWPHARVICEETTGLEPAAAAALEAHFQDPAAADPARGCPAGDLTPGRFRAKARTWRERHHPVSIETRHRKSAADRRLEYVPDRDGMAWLSAYLPADTAASSPTAPPRFGGS